MKLAKKTLKYTWWLIPLLIGATLAVSTLVTFDRAMAPKTTLKAKPAVTKTPVIPAFNKKRYSTTDPSSIWVIVNKQHPLIPQDYVPGDLVTTVGATISSKAQVDFEAMNRDALAQGVNFTIVSGYRSFTAQGTIYNNYVATFGQTSTDTFSARAGYSEHQTGLAIDFGSSTGATCNFGDCFGATIEGQWLVAHAPDYGFILRYTSAKQTVTGYKSEPWHYRYVGRDLAAEMKKQSITTLEEFFSITGGEIYS